MNNVEYVKDLDVGNGCVLGDYRCLSELVRHFKWRTAVETGTSSGVGSIVLCNSGVKSVTTIDIKEHPKVEKQIKSSGFEKNIKRIIGNSQDVLKTLNERYDLAYIDGDHKFYGAMTDVTLVQDKVDYIILHDTANYSGVKKCKKILVRKWKWKYISIASPRKIHSNMGNFNYLGRCWSKEDDFYSWRDGKRNYRAFPGITVFKVK